MFFKSRKFFEPAPLPSGKGIAPVMPKFEMVDGKIQLNGVVVLPTYKTDNERRTAFKKMKTEWKNWKKNKEK